MLHIHRSKHNLKQVNESICVGMATRPGLCPIAKETAKAAPTLCTEYGPNVWMDGNDSFS